MSKDKSKAEQISYYEEENLKKLAFWNATGSGKTLLMHVNILQYKHYFHKKHRRDELEQVILLTPSEDLSKHHIREFKISGLQAALFNKNVSSEFRRLGIIVIDIHKIKDEKGEKTVAIDAFEGKSLVLVDEGHRGSSGDEWRNKREKLSNKDSPLSIQRHLAKPYQEIKN